MNMKTVLATLAVVVLSTPAFAAGGGQRGDRGGHSQVQRNGSDHRATSYRDYRGSQNNFRYNSRNNNHSYNSRNSYRSYRPSRSSSGNYGYQYGGSYPSYNYPSYSYGYGYPTSGALRCSYPGGYGSPYGYNYPGANAGRCSSYGYDYEDQYYGDQYGYRY